MASLALIVLEKDPTEAKLCVLWEARETGAIKRKPRGRLEGYEGKLGKLKPVFGFGASIWLFPAELFFGGGHEPRKLGKHVEFGLNFMPVRPCTVLEHLPTCAAGAFCDMALDTQIEGAEAWLVEGGSQGRLVKLHWP